MGHLNSILARVEGNLNNNFQKSQMPGGLPGGWMLKLRFDRYIRGASSSKFVPTTRFQSAIRAQAYNRWGCQE